MMNEHSKKLTSALKITEDDITWRYTTTLNIIMMKIYRTQAKMSFNLKEKNKKQKKPKNPQTSKKARRNWQCTVRVAKQRCCLMKSVLGLTLWQSVKQHPQYYQLSFIGFNSLSMCPIKAEDSPNAWSSLCHCGHLGNQTADGRSLSKLRKETNEQEAGNPVKTSAGMACDHITDPHL